jgi:hypothetical protein
MELNGRLGTIGKATGVAASAAPVIRRFARDEELRTDLSQFVASANDLVRELASDTRLRDDVRHMIEAAQSSRERLREDARPRGGRWMFFLGAGMVLGVLVLAGALLYPRTRQSVIRAADQTKQKTSATVHDLRQRVTRRSSTPEEPETAIAGGEHGGPESASQAA